MILPILVAFDDIDFSADTMGTTACGGRKLETCAVGRSIHGTQCYKKVLLRHKT